MKDSEQFELLTAEIFHLLRNNPQYESVEHNVELHGKDGLRQIDILLRGKVGPWDALTIIECKDHNRNLSVEFIDQLHSKMQDVNANQGVLVARKGFSKKAMRKANRLGINLCTAQKAKSKKWAIQQKFPIIIEETFPCNVVLQFNTKVEHKTTSVSADDISIVNGVDITKLFETMWNKNKIQIDESLDVQSWIPDGLLLPNKIASNVEIDEYQVRFKTGQHYYFGYLDELEGSKAIQYIEEDKNSGSLIFQIAELIKYRKNFSLFRDPNDLPKLGSLHIEGKAVRQLKLKVANKLLDPDDPVLSVVSP